MKNDFPLLDSWTIDWCFFFISLEFLFNEWSVFSQLRLFFVQNLLRRISLWEERKWIIINKPIWMYVHLFVNVLRQLKFNVCQFYSDWLVIFHNNSACPFRSPNTLYIYIVFEHLFCCDRIVFYIVVCLSLSQFIKSKSANDVWIKCFSSINYTHIYSLM